MSDALVQLGTLGNFIRGNGIAKSDLVDEGGLPCIRYAEIYTKYGEVIQDPISRVSNDATANAQKLEYGDIIFPSSGETAEEIGKASAFVGREETYVGGDTIILRGHRQDPIYLAHALNSWELNRQKFGLATGNSVVHIYAQELSQLSLWLPALAEQQKMVEILSDCDTVLGNQFEMIKQHEQLLHALIDREMSNPSNSRGVKLGRILSESRRSLTIDDPSKRLSVRLNLKGVEKRVYRGTEAENSTLFFERKAGQLIYGKQNIFNGAIGLVPDELDGYASTQDIPAFDIHEDVDKNWLLSFMSRPNFFKQLERYASGSGSKRLHPEELFRIEVKLPHLDEQLKSSSRLKDARCALEDAKRLGDLLSKQKRGLMQQLLTGKLRVKEAA